MDVNKPISNPKLIDSIDKLNTNYNKKSERNFFKQLLEAEFLAPVIIKPNPESNAGKALLKEDTSIEFFGVSNNESQLFFPAFTDWNALRKWNGKSEIQTVIMGFKDYERIIFEKNNKSWAGFVINPNRENLVLNKEQMSMVYNDQSRIEKNESIMVGEPKNYPDEMVDALKGYLPKVKSVKSAYLLLMLRNQTDESYLIVIDTDETPEHVFEQVANVATKHLKPDEKIDFVPLSNSFGENAVVDQQPFYRRRNGSI